VTGPDFYPCNKGWIWRLYTDISVHVFFFIYGLRGNPQGGGMQVQLRNVELQNPRFQLLLLSSLSQAKMEADAWAFPCRYKASQPSRLLLPPCGPPGLLLPCGFRRNLVGSLSRLGAPEMQCAWPTDMWTRPGTRQSYPQPWVKMPGSLARQLGYGNQTSRRKLWNKTWPKMECTCQFGV
jgi:hypothetical protein